MGKKECGEKRPVLILTATSGDTGKAALEGFRDVKGTNICVFYPSHGVSPLQKDQMRKQPGGNVRVCGIEGNFDDAQSAVKEIFAAEEKMGRSFIPAPIPSISAVSSRRWFTTCGSGCSLCGAAPSARKKRSMWRCRRGISEISSPRGWQSRSARPLGASSALPMKPCTQRFLCDRGL